MATQRYNDYYISVFHTPDNSGSSSCIPFVEIRHKRGHDPEARLMLNEAFSTARDANAHAFTMGKRWVDERIAKGNSVQLGAVATKTAGESPPVRSGFKSWLSSLLFRFA